MTRSSGRPWGAQWPEDLSAVAAELDAHFRSNPYLKHLGGEIESWGLGWARTMLTPTGDVANIVGTAHGGVVAGLADCAFEVACNSYGRACVAAELSVHFLAPSRIGKTLVAEAREIGRSTRLASYEVNVKEDVGGSRPVATLLALAYRTERWHLGTERYPDDWRTRY